jgi:hypothetical protein
VQSLCVSYRGVLLVLAVNIAACRDEAFFDLIKAFVHPVSPSTQVHKLSSQQNGVSLFRSEPLCALVTLPEYVPYLLPYLSAVYVPYLLPYLSAVYVPYLLPYLSAVTYRICFHTYQLQRTVSASILISCNVPYLLPITITVTLSLSLSVW